MGFHRRGACHIKGRPRPVRFIAGGQHRGIRRRAQRGRAVHALTGRPIRLLAYYNSALDSACSVPEGSRACAFGACARSICRLHHEFALCTLRQPPGPVTLPLKQDHLPCPTHARGQRHAHHRSGPRGFRAGGRPYDVCTPRASIFICGHRGTCVDRASPNFQATQRLALVAIPTRSADARCVVCCRRIVHRPATVRTSHGGMCAGVSECSPKALGG